MQLHLRGPRTVRMLGNNGIDVGGEKWKNPSQQTVLTVIRKNIKEYQYMVSLEQYLYDTGNFLTVCCGN